MGLDRQHTRAISKVLSEVALISHLSSDVLAWSIPLASVYAAFKFVPVTEMHKSLIRLHHIVDKAAEILAHIRKDHHTQPLKNVLLHLAHIENALARLEEPIFAAAVHLILYVEA